MRKLLSALTVPTGLALLIIPVQTQDAPTPPSATSSKTTMAPGQRIIVANAGAPPGATVTIILHRSPSSMAMADDWTASSPAPAGPIVGQAVAADDGSFRSSVTIPPSTEPGAYSLVSATGGRQLGTIALRVGTSGARAVSGLPFSGADALPGVLAGAGLIVAGGLLLLGVQYRRSRIA
jgi:hypothetical protein